MNFRANAKITKEERFFRPTNRYLFTIQIEGQADVVLGCAGFMLEKNHIIERLSSCDVARLQYVAILEGQEVERLEKIVSK